MLYYDLATIVAHTYADRQDTKKSKKNRIPFSFRIGTVYRTPTDSTFPSPWSVAIVNLLCIH